MHIIGKRKIKISFDAIVFLVSHLRLRIGFPMVSRKGVKNLCFTHNVIEIQALKICEEIREHSVYKLVSVATTGGESIQIKENLSIQSNLNLPPGGTLPLVTKVMLENTDGRSYSVNVDEAGLQFAKGLITYKEYKLLQNREKRKLTTILIASGGTFFLMSWSFLELLF
ncbi:hypothetical protein ACFWGC_25315 [Cytobacillus pseudoceanisediminis]|uniref:hypothetical protein n=1 Tax=Cytobacillus pseudoceanisediminis TaxID=3051614 RepID=UPI00365F1F7F